MAAARESDISYGSIAKDLPVRQVLIIASDLLLTLLFLGHILIRIIKLKLFLQCTNLFI